MRTKEMPTRIVFLKGKMDSRAKPAGSTAALVFVFGLSFICQTKAQQTGAEAQRNIIVPGPRFIPESPPNPLVVHGVTKENPGSCSSQVNLILSTLKHKITPPPFSASKANGPLLVLLVVLNLLIQSAESE